MLPFPLSLAIESSAMLPPNYHYKICNPLGQDETLKFKRNSGADHPKRRLAFSLSSAALRMAGRLGRPRFAFVRRRTAKKKGACRGALEVDANGF
jgi:hypothetical protein